MASVNFRFGALVPAILLLAPGCVGPNPLLDAGEEGSEATSNEGDGDGDTAGDGDGDGDTTGDGDGDGDTGPDPCNNNQLDPDETDVDCGGSCEPCGDGLGCALAEDCASLVCVDMICQTPTCDDSVQNGDELEVDCGGGCSFCEHGPFHAELDDFEGTSARRPQVAAYSDASYVLTFASDSSARVRWLDELGAPSQPSAELSDAISYSMGKLTKVAAGDPATLSLTALEVGQGPLSVSDDLFLVGRTPDTVDVEFRVNPSNKEVIDGDLVVDGSRVTVAWREDGDVLVRRWDYTRGQGGDWVDIDPEFAEPDPDAYIGSTPGLGIDASGLVVVAWVRCNANMAAECAVVARRYQDGWVDAQPAIVATVGSGYFTDPRVAIADDGRVGFAWVGLGLDEGYPQAAIFSEDFTIIDAPWAVQPMVPSPASIDIAALTDGSFAIAWSDAGQSTVHLRRFIGPDEPKVPSLGDEAPWPDSMNPTGVSVASVDNHLIVTWSATVDGVAQIQGQVLSY